MGAVKDPFANISEESFGTGPEQVTEKTPIVPRGTNEEMGGDPDYKKPPTGGAIKAGGKSAFRPASGADDSLSEIFESFDESSIFDFVGDKFDEKVNTDPAPGEGLGQQRTFANTPRKTQVKQIVDPDDANFGAVMYVEALEMAMIVLCEWIDKSAIPGAYKFKESLKQKHAEMAAKLMVHENVYVSPMALFVISGILLVGSNAIKAFKNKKKIEKQIIYAEKSRQAIRRPENGQAKLFDLDPVELPRKNFKAVMIDGVAYYFWNTERDAKAKKDELEEVPPELSDFLFRYNRENNGKWPDRKTVMNFLKTTKAA